MFIDIEEIFKRLVGHIQHRRGLDKKLQKQHAFGRCSSRLDPDAPSTEELMGGPEVTQIGLARNCITIAHCDPTRNCEHRQLTLIGAIKHDCGDWKVK